MVKRIVGPIPAAHHFFDDSPILKAIRIRPTVQISPRKPGPTSHKLV